MFSSDLTSQERWSRMGHMASVPTAVFLSSADQYVPGGDPRRTPEALAEAFRSVLMPVGSNGGGNKELSRVCVIDGGDHELNEPKHAQEFIDGVETFVVALGPK